MNWLLERIGSHNNKEAIVYQDKIYTYGDLFARSLHYRDTIGARLKEGEVVVLLSDYSFSSIAMFMALIDNRNIIVPITTEVKHDIEERLSEAQADKIVTIEDEEYRIIASDHNEEKHVLIRKLQDSGSAGLILFSSGSTGKAKSMIHNLDMLLDTYRYKKTKSLTLLIFLMFDHIGGLNTLFSALSMAMTIIIPSKRDPEHVCDLIEKYKINILPASPTFLNLILMSEAYRSRDLSSLIMITYGTEQMPEALLVRLRETFPRVKFVQTFGTSETGIARATSKSSSSTCIKIDDPNLEYRIVDGELWLRSKTQVLGYLNCPMDRFTHDGWFKTGDLVETEEDDYIRIIGRNSEIINVGGQKVLPAELEGILLQMPEIADCVVYGFENPITGQVVAVDVALSIDIPPHEIKRRILTFCRGKLERYKTPARVNVVDRTNFSDRFKKIRK
ncbi:MAG: ANL family adenylate-forming protein [bacterium]